jgi:uncharacterized membrane protein YgdD (TMEM256/DUF423 family)
MNGWAWVRVGAVMGFLGVAIGAFGAHGLKSRLDSLGTAATFHTGVEYHFYHALAILAVGALGAWLPARNSLGVAGWAFLVGIVLFSGSLYVLSVTGIKPLGMITPFGGVAFLVGWAALAYSAWTLGVTPEVELRSGSVPTRSSSGSEVDHGSSAAGLMIGDAADLRTGSSQ